MHRRMFLAVTSTFILLPGCQSNGTAYERLSKIEITNQGDAIQPSLLVREDGDVVFDSDVQVPAEDTVVVNEPWMQESRNYQIELTTPSGNSSSINMETLSERFDVDEDECLALDFTIYDDQTIELFVGAETCDSEDTGE